MAKEEDKQKPKQKQYNDGKRSVMLLISTCDKLDKLKIHPRQTYNEQITSLVDKAISKPKKK